MNLKHFSLSLSQTHFSATMGQKEKKKSKINQIPLCNKETNCPNLWPDLPQQLVHLTARESTLFRDICYKGVTKSLRAESYKCSSRNPTKPWFHVFVDDNRSAYKQPHIFNITFKQLGLVMVTKDHLWDPVFTSWRYLPPWDSRDPFLCSVLSSSPYIPKMETFFVLVLTGISHPAFIFYRIGAVGENFAWIKEDCTIVDPNCSNPFERHHFMRFTNAIGFKGKFYALSLQGTLAVIESIDSHLRITALGKKRANPSVSSLHFRECMLESDGEVLLVFLISKASSHIVDAVEIYQLDIDRLTWIKMESLGDRTLFLGSNCCMPESASKVGCKRNCVYFTNRNADCGWWVYDLDSATISPSWDDSSASQKPPVWVQPS